MTDNETDEQEGQVDTYTPILSVRSAAFETVAYGLLGAAALSLAVRCVRRAKWRFDDLKYGILRGWLV